MDDDDCQYDAVRVGEQLNSLKNKKKEFVQKKQDLN